MRDHAHTISYHKTFSGNFFLKKSNTAVYAEYLRRYVESYADQGIDIDFLVPQNEPELEANGYPTMSLTPEQEKELVLALAEEVRRVFKIQNDQKNYSPRSKLS